LNIFYAPGFTLTLLDIAKLEANMNQHKLVTLPKKSQMDFDHYFIIFKRAVFNSQTTLLVVLRGFFQENIAH
jgi:hypothetical protein